MIALVKNPVEVEEHGLHVILLPPGIVTIGPNAWIE